MPYANTRTLKANRQGKFKLLGVVRISTCGKLYIGVNMEYVRQQGKYSHNDHDRLLSGLRGKADGSFFIDNFHIFFLFFIFKLIKCVLCMCVCAHNDSHDDKL